MKDPYFPNTEERRLAALDRYSILDTAPEQEYNDLVELAAAICETPIATLTFVDRDHQWFKASIGVPQLRTDRCVSFCNHTIAQTELFVVPDAACNLSFAENPFVAGDPFVRFYAGMPLLTADGYVLGTICVVDTKPRELTSVQTQALKALSRQAMSLLELRRTVASRDSNLAESAAVQVALQESETRLRESETNLQIACRAGQIGLWAADLQTQRITWSRSQAELFGINYDEFDGKWETVLSRIHPGDRERLLAARILAIETLTPMNLEMRVLHPDGQGGSVRWLLVKGEVAADAQGSPLQITGAAIDITERKQSEQALHLSEERLRSVVTGAPLILFSLDDTGKFMVSEGKGLDRLGLQPGQAVGHSAYEMYAGFPEILVQLERAFGGEAFSERAEIGELTFETWYSPVFGEDGHVSSIIGVACDITARRQAEEALRSSEARFLAFMDNIPTFTYVKDHEGRYVYCNDAFERLCERPQNELIGRTALDLWPGEVGHKIHADTLDALTRDSLTETLTEIPDPEGGIRQLLAFRFTFRDSAAALFVGCLALDITEQKRTEKQWKETQQKLEETLVQLNATLESTADGLLVVNAQEQVLHANGTFYEMWHMPEEMRWTEDHTKQIAYVMEQVRDPAAFYATVRGLDAHPEKTTFDVINCKDGRIFERYSRSLLIHGGFAGRVWSFRDVTQQERTRQDLIQAKNDALASVQAKSEFLANMSHEIRTPMNGIKGMTDLMLATALMPTQKHYAISIKNSADSLLTIINDILDFSKIDAGKLTLETVPFSIEQIMYEVKDLLDPRAQEKNLELMCSLPVDFPPCLLGDPARMRQILTNLVGNALKFTERGKVVLEVRVLRETETHAEFRLSVRDTGIGIPKDRQAAIFDSFTQADSSITRRYGGTGLGLAICLRLTDLMAGRIGLDSKPGKGSDFWLIVTLEKTSIVLEQPAATFWPTEADPLGLHVLLAEDNMINQEVTCGFLEMWGCTVDVAGDGWQACLAVRRKPYDLVLMDIQMPEMDGRQATGEIRGRERGTERHLPIIAMTAHNMQGDREQCLACGMDDYISKPIDPDLLLSALRRWGLSARSSTSRTLPPAETIVLEPRQAAEKLPVLDIERLHRSCAGKATLERRIMIETLRLTPAFLGRLRAAIGDENAELTRFEAHTLKGSSRTLGAEALGNTAGMLEETAKRGDLTDAPALLSRMESEWTELRAALEDCLASITWKEIL